MVVNSERAVILEKVGERPSFLTTTLPLRTAEMSRLRADYKVHVITWENSIKIMSSNCEYLVVYCRFSAT